MPPQTRRKFLSTGVKATAAAAALATPAQMILSPATAQAKSIQFPEGTFEPDVPTGRRILVTYASNHGSTGGVAEFMAKSLAESGHHVDLLNMDNVQSLTDYDGYVLGAPIHYDNWTGDARDFVEDNLDVLQTKPVACFFTCLTLAKNDDRGRNTAAGYAGKIAELLPHVEADQVGRFAGALDYSKMSIFGSALAHTFFAVLGVSEGDYRDWDAIASWTRDANSALKVEKQAWHMPAGTRSFATRS